MGLNKDVREQVCMYLHPRYLHVRRQLLMFTMARVDLELNLLPKLDSACTKLGHQCIMKLCFFFPFLSFLLYPFFLCFFLFFFF